MRQPEFPRAVPGPDAALAPRNPGFVLDVDYEALVSDPVAQSRRVFEFCGLDWNPGVVEPAQWTARSINTLSSVQARQRVSSASIGRWRSYERWLEPLRGALAAERAGRPCA